MREVVSDFGQAIGFKFSDQRFTDVIDLSGEMGGFDPDDAAPIEAIAETDIPILLMHGEDDDLIPIQHSFQLYRAANRDNVELIRVKNADHTSLGETVLEPVRLAAIQWFDRHLQASDSRPDRHQAKRDTIQAESIQ
jgi:alpha-beta hydrolase superfamily lysophospholipase